MGIFHALITTLLYYQRKPQHNEEKVFHSGFKTFGVSINQVVVPQWQMQAQGTQMYKLTHPEAKKHEEPAQSMVQTIFWKYSREIIPECK